VIAGKACPQTEWFIRREAEIPTTIKTFWRGNLFIPDSFFITF
jgi:hypothetical protein